MLFSQEHRPKIKEENPEITFVSLAPITENDNAANHNCQSHITVVNGFSFLNYVSRQYRAKLERSLVKCGVLSPTKKRKSTRTPSKKKGIE